MMDLGDSRVSVISSVSSTSSSTTLDYGERKLAGRCTERGCPDDAEDGYQLCPSHRTKANARKRASAKRRRKDKRICSRCCKRPRFGGRWGCAVCLIAVGRTGPRVVDVSVDDRSSREVKGWEGSPTNAGRKRLRGGPRGAPSATAQREQDKRFMLACVARWIDGMAWLDSVDGIPSSERKAAELAALSHIRLLERFCEEAMVRGRYDQRIAKDQEQRAKDRYERDAKNQAKLAKLAAEFAKTGR